MYNYTVLSCGPPPSIPNGIPDNPTSTIVGVTVRYSCHAGFIHLGSMITCLTTGSWSELPSCQGESFQTHRETCAQTRNHTMIHIHTHSPSPSLPFSVLHKLLDWTYRDRHIFREREQPCLSHRPCCLLPTVGLRSGWWYGTMVLSKRFIYW